MDSEVDVLRFHWYSFGDKTIVMTEDGEIGIAVCSDEDVPSLRKGIHVALVRALAHEVLPTSRNGGWPVSEPLCQGRGKLRRSTYYWYMSNALVGFGVARSALRPDKPAHISHRVETAADNMIRAGCVRLPF